MVIDIPIFPSPAKADQNFKTIKNQILQSLKNIEHRKPKRITVSKASRKYFQDTGKKNFCMPFPRLFFGCPLFCSFLCHLKYTTASCLGRCITNPGVAHPKPLSGAIVEKTFHTFEIEKASLRKHPKTAVLLKVF